ncbi:MAG: hypothetical protein JNK29_19455 [Anaerolineales bacterium]|nr:hypothetical protein [Anaerolineales bacterium]
MTQTVWEVVDSIKCERTGETAQLLEQRVYASDPLPDVGRPFKVLARKCSTGGECNLAGFPCRWSYINPTYDPFSDK